MVEAELPGGTVAVEQPVEQNREFVRIRQGLPTPCLTSQSAGLSRFVDPQIVQVVIEQAFRVATTGTLGLGHHGGRSLRPCGRPDSDCLFGRIALSSNCGSLKCRNHLPKSL